MCGGMGGGWEGGTRGAAGEVNAEFKLEYLQRGEAGMKGSMVGGQREEETERLSLNHDCRIDGRRREELGGVGRWGGGTRVFISPESKRHVCQTFAFPRRRRRRRASIHPTGQETEKAPGQLAGTGGARETTLAQPQRRVQQPWRR